MFLTFNEKCMQLFDYKFNANFFQIDNSNALRNGICEVFGEVNIVNCFIHVKRLYYIIFQYKIFFNL